MQILQAFKFQLLPKYQQQLSMRKFAGCCRYVWNKALALEKDAYENTGKYISYASLCSIISQWRKEESTVFLSEAHSQILQQTLKDLDKSYKNFFEHRAAFPKFKKKGVYDSFRYPQGFKIDENNNRIYLPKICWVRYRNSRTILGTPKQITVSLSAGKWYVSIQTEREIADPVHPSTSAVGIDMGVVRFATLSDGTYIEPLNSFRKHEAKLVKLQRKLSKMQKFSNNWQKQKRKLQKHYRKIANVRNDFLHKLSTTISKNHAMVVVEDLQVRNMSRSAAGNIEQPGRSGSRCDAGSYGWRQHCYVRAKSTLNKSILDQGWFEFRRQLAYKLYWRGGMLIKVQPQYTSQTCNNCGCIDRNSRISQSVFKCTSCGFEINADLNAALNILAAGHAVSACDPKGSSEAKTSRSLHGIRESTATRGAERAQAAAMNQEPAYGMVAC